jgi:hypothetical protein
MVKEKALCTGRCGRQWTTGLRIATAAGRQILHHPKKKATRLPVWPVAMTQDAYINRLAASW